MQNILKELYYCNLHQDEDMLLNDEEYQQAVNQSRAIETAFLSTLDDAGLELYYRLEIANAKQDSIESAYIYINGFRTGAKIMLACLS
ncbi:MAG: hypothetical protein FWE92_01460 [Defluviitaleaceae bacterium]|nr:hypothetical protein [Defluviitaleaceae bacterium]